METSNRDVQQSTSTYTHVQPVKQHKEVQVQTDLKHLRSINQSIKKFIQVPYQEGIRITNVNLC